MRHIHALTPDKVPRDDEFHFKDRAKALVDKWHDILNANKTPAATNGNENKDTASPVATEPTKAATTNGSVTGKTETAAEVAMTNGTKEEEPAKAEAPAAAETVKEVAPAAMDVDADAKGEADADAPADADAAGDESVLADVTMSEAT